MTGSQPPHPLMRNPCLSNVLSVASRGNQKQFRHSSISETVVERPRPARTCIFSSMAVVGNIKCNLIHYTSYYIRHEVNFSFIC